MINYTYILFSVVDPMCIREASILWGLNPSCSRDAHKIEVCFHLKILSHWWLLDTLCYREIKPLLTGLWSVYLLQAYSEFISNVYFINKKFLSFIWEHSTFLPTTHQQNTTSSIIQHLSNNSCQEREKGGKRNLAHSWQSA